MAHLAWGVVRPPGPVPFQGYLKTGLDGKSYGAGPPGDARRPVSGYLTRAMDPKKTIQTQAEAELRRRVAALEQERDALLELLVAQQVRTSSTPAPARPAL